MEKLLLTPYPSKVIAGNGKLSGRAFSDRGGVFTELLPTEGDIKILFTDALPSVGDNGCFNDSEGYVLDISEDAVTVYASAEAGFFYGAVTLKQLICQFGACLPCLIISDKPVIRHRGAQISYAQINVSYRDGYLRRFIRKMAELKINHIYLYLEWKYNFPSVPQAHSPRNMSPEQAKAICKYASRYHISVIPELNVIGHTGDFLAMEYFTPLHEYDREHFVAEVGESAALCPNNPRTLPLMKAALNDIADAFDSDIVHVGGDEVEMLGKCPLCAPLAEKIGAAGIYVDYLCKIRDILAARNRKMGIWGDMFRDYTLGDAEEKKANMVKFSPLKEGTIIYDWSYDGPGKWSLEGFVNNGFTVIASTSVHGCSVSAPCMGQIGNQHAYFVDAVRLGVFGGLATDWIYGYGYHGEQMLSLFASAEAMLWQGTDERFAVGQTIPEFDAAVSKQLYGTDGEAVKYIRMAGDAEAEMLQYFPRDMGGSYLRRAAYMNISPLAFYIKYSYLLRGDKLPAFRESIKKLEAAWDKLEAASSDCYTVFLKAPLVMYKYLYNRFAVAAAFHIEYANAAALQYNDNAAFCLALDRAAEALDNGKGMFDEPEKFMKLESTVLGLEDGSFMRVAASRKNLSRLADFTRSLKDNRRPLPSVSNINKWLFSSPLANFWAAGNDYWEEEKEPFLATDTDAGSGWGAPTKY